MAAEKPDLILPSQLEGLMTQAPAGFLMVDANGRILYVNRMIEKMFAYSRNELIGQPVEVLIPERFHDDHTARRMTFTKNPSSRKMGKGRNLNARRKSGEEFPVEVGLGYAHSRTGILISAVVIDISRQQKVEKERERLIVDLKDALSRVKQLSGLLPICASCKKIRDDGGYWNQIEAYIRDHSEAVFSHGICPDCARKLYPDLDLLDD